MSRLRLLLDRASYVNVTIAGNRIMIEIVSRKDAKNYEGLSLINAMAVLINMSIPVEREDD